jgi:flavodoxin I
MKAVVVYDSVYGNTEQIARSIGGAVSGDVRVLRAGEVGPAELASLDLLIVGSPTYGGRPTPAARDFLNRVPQAAVKGVAVAAFDTRISVKVVRIFGFAAGRIAGSLKKKGGTLVLPPEGFFVEGTEGPLKEGELERAAGWAQGIMAAMK